jgi:nicotinamidase-related amidase
MKALLIIDMQKISFTPETPRFDSEEVVKRINSLSKNFRENNDTVIHMQHDGTKDGFCIPNTEEWEIIDSINVKKNDIIIGKIANDCFYKSELNNILQKNNIEELIITGCATDFCVDSTVKSAITNEYIVIVISDGHTTADRPNIKANLVIDHYNWIWKEMIPIKETIKVISTEKYLNN